VGFLASLGMTVHSFYAARAGRRGDSMTREIHVGTLALILSFAPFAFSQTKSAATPSAGVDWKALDHKWLDSERTGDLDYLEKFFADSYVLVLANGQTYTKKEWLGILRGPDRPTLLVLDPENIQVHVFGNVAILTDHTTIKGHDRKGNSMDGEYNVFRVVIKKDGNWLATGVVMNPDLSKK
jgi:ketosteroid isomerase-like protein